MPRKGEYLDLTGQRFGRLVAVEFSGQVGRRKTQWVCQCDCGNKIIVDTCHLRSGHSKSCGCISTERIKYLNYKTGMANTRLYRTYRNMLNRCYWKRSIMFENYGGRGIGVCEEWRNKENGFEVFAKWSFENGYTDELTLDRIDNNGNYSPENCRWVDMYVQANNKRNNWRLKVNGEIDTVGNWARRLNVSYWNLLHYAKGGKNMKYPELEIEAVNE